MRFLIPAVFLIFYSLISSSQNHHGCYLPDLGAGPRERNFDMQHMLLRVSFDPEAGLVNGDVTYDLSILQKQVDSVFFDAPGIKFSEVSFNGKPANYKTSAEGITFFFNPPLSWETKHKINLKYEAAPRKGIYFIGWNDVKGLSRKQIWTQGQGIDNRYWIPGFDDQNDKLTTEVIVTFDSDYKVLSNGDLKKKKSSKAGTTEWHYSLDKPHSPYLVMLGIGKYEIESRKSKSGVPVNLWYYPEYPERVEPTYRYSVEMMDWMEKEFGVPYPWKTYAQIPVQDFIYGAMENTTATVFGDFYFIDNRAFLDRYYIGTNAHELAHMWFGDYVTAISSRHHWLHESFATHYQKHFERFIFGEDHFQWNRRRELERTLAAAKQNNNPIVHLKAGSGRHYPKGSLVLEMMKYVLGDEQFNKALTVYLQQNAYDLVDTHEFYLAFFETLGVDLSWFFDQWLYRGGEPEYKVYFQQAIIDSISFSVFDIEQTHETSDYIGLFKMPVVFEVHYSDGSFDSTRVWIEYKHHSVKIANPHGKVVDYVLFDPNSWIIKTVNFEKPYNMLSSQALKAKNMIDRYDAVAALKTFPLDQKRETLKNIFKYDTYPAVRAAAITQLANDEQSVEVLKLALTDPERDVRLSALTSTKSIPIALKSDFERLLSDSSYSIVATALKKLAKEFPGEADKYLSSTGETYGMGNNVRIAWLEAGAAIDKEKYLPEVVELTSSSYEFITRREAMDLLKRLNYLNDEAIANLFDAAMSTNNRLRSHARSILKNFTEQTENRILIEDYYNSREWSPAENQMWKNILF